MIPFEHKLVAIVNKTLEVGTAMNAIAHMTLGLGAHVDHSLLRLDTYQDRDGNTYPNISQMPFIVLRGTSGEIRKAVANARTQGIPFGTFLNTMTGGTYQSQLDTTLQTAEADLTYYGAVFFGPWEEISQLTKKFSLFK